MLERVFRDPVLTGLIKTSGFNEPLNDLAAMLEGQRFSPRTIDEYLRTAGHFAHWLRSGMHSKSAITETSVDDFLNQHLPDCQCPVPGWNPCARARLSRFMTILRSHGLASEIPMSSKTIFNRKLRSTSSVAPFSDQFREVATFALCTSCLSELSPPNSFGQVPLR